MSEMATYIGVEPRTVIGNVALTRGTRVKMNVSGTMDIQDATAIGDFIMLGDQPTVGQPGVAVSAWGGGKVAVLVVAGVTVNIADLAYTAAAGQFTNVSTAATLVGRFTQPVTGGASATLTECELFN